MPGNTRTLLQGLRKRLVPVLVIVAVIAGGAYYWRQNQQKTKAAAAVQTVPTTKVKRDTIESVLTGTASIVYSDRRAIQATVSGTMSKVLTKDGATVKAGDLLATIQNETVLDELEQARLDLDTLYLKREEYRTVTASERASAQTALRKAEEALKDAKEAVADLVVTCPVDGRVSTISARKGQKVAKGDVLLTVSEDTTVMVVAQVSQTDISDVSVGQTVSISFGSELPGATGKVTYVGVEAVEGTKSSTVPVYIKIPNPNGVYRTGLMANAYFPIEDEDGDDASVGASATVASLSTYSVKSEVAGTVQSISVSEGDSVTAGKIVVQLENDALATEVEYAESDLIVAREDWDRIQQGYAPGTTDIAIKQLESSIKQAEAKLRTKTEAAADLEIRSPIDGVVLSHGYDETAEITVGDELFVLADPNQMEMVVPVDELDVMKVVVGQKAAITVDALPGQTFTGTVTKIGSEGTVKDGIATYNVTVTVDLPKGLKGSMTGTAAITLARKENVLTVPAEAVKTSGKRKYVSVQKDGKFTEVDVTVGISSSKTVEILTGLEEGQVVQLTTTSSTTTQQNQGPGGMMPGMPGGPR